MIAGIGPHGAFIVLSYAIAALVMLGLVGWVLMDHRIQTRRLAALEARGIRRRSAAQARPSADPPGKAEASS